MTQAIIKALEVPLWNVNKMGVPERVHKKHGQLWISIGNKGLLLFVGQGGNDFAKGE